MSTTVKIVLGVVAFFFLAGLGTCVGGYYWFKSNAGKLKEKGDAVKVEAHAFAQTHEEVECLDSSFERLDACSGGPVDQTMCRALAGIYLDECLPKARRTEGFCEGVPSMDSIMEGATWAAGVCGELDRAGDQACGRHVSQLIRYCARREG